MYGDRLTVIYEDSQEERDRKQAELREEVSRVIAEIIEPGMTEVEMEFAINDYLCEYAEYDNGARENAKQYDFKSADPEFNDSFTAYGILIKKVGGCEGYAAAFKLLADEAGLESIVVSGHMYSGVPHAWNRVLIERDWMTLDVTNNGNEIMPNSILNLPDRVASTVLVEKDCYVMERYLYDFSGILEDVEYYRLEGKFYSQKNIVDKLVKGLKNQGVVVLRTDYDLTEKQYEKIVQKVLQRGGWPNVLANMWLGTIYLELP
jgi:hypothetical protein